MALLGDLPPGREPSRANYAVNGQLGAEGPSRAAGGARTAGGARG